MRSATLPNPSALAKSAVALALAGACLFATEANARDGHGQFGGTRPVAASPAGGQWHGRHVRGDGHRWHGRHGHRGHHWHGHHRHHRHHWHFHPGWAWGLGAGVALTYPWWGWGHPYGYYVYERPVGVVIDERPIDVTPLPPPAEASPAFRWYCPSPAGYHPEIRECTQAWLKVLPPDAQPQSPPVR